jgi:hypothetical protein
MNLLVNFNLFLLIFYFILNLKIINIQILKTIKYLMTFYYLLFMSPKIQEYHI